MWTQISSVTCISPINLFRRCKGICDLLREKGPTAVKRRFKTQLTAFCRKMLCNIFTFASQPQLNAFQSRKKEKNAVNLILLI